MGEPLASVVIPVFNIEVHLRQCLDSVLGQTLQDIEIICVDDGSTDQSAVILREYAERDARVQVITQANAGPGVARNTGMAAAKGEHLIFLDSDDWFEPDFLEKMVKKAQSSHADVTICRAVEFDTNTGRELPSEWMLKTQYLPHTLAFSPGEVSEHLFQFTYGMPWDKLYRTDYIKETGLVYPALRNSEDLAFVFPSLFLAQRLTILDRVMIHHRVNRSASVSNSRTTQPEAPYEAFQIVKSCLERRGLTECYQHSFLNWAMEFLIWHVANMGDKDIQRQYFNTLREKWLPELKFGAYPASYYENKFTYCKYLLVRYTPFVCFRCLVQAYKKIKYYRGRLLWKKKT